MTNINEPSPLVPAAPQALVPDVRIKVWNRFHGSLTPNWLMRRPEVSPGEKLLYALLAQHAGRDGNCFPKQKTLAKEMGTTSRNVRNYLVGLVRHGLIEIIQRGFTLPNKYFFFDHCWMHEDPFDWKKPSDPDWNSSPAPDGNNRSTPDQQDSPGLDRPAPSGPVKRIGSDQKDQKEEDHSISIVREHVSVLEVSPVKQGEEVVGSSSSLSESITKITSPADAAVELLNHLNKQAGTDYKPRPQLVGLINARLREVDGDKSGVLKMITRQVTLWKPDSRMAGFLRPNTLFAKDKFHDYYGQREVVAPPSAGPTPLQVSAITTQLRVIAARLLELKGAEFDHLVKERNDLLEERARLYLQLKKVSA